MRASWRTYGSDWNEFCIRTGSVAPSTAVDLVREALRSLDGAGSAIDHNVATMGVYVTSAGPMLVVRAQTRDAMQAYLKVLGAELTEAGIDGDIVRFVGERPPVKEVRPVPAITAGLALEKLPEARAAAGTRVGAVWAATAAATAAVLGAGITWCREIVEPTYLMHGYANSRVPPEDAEFLAGAALERGTPVAITAADATSFRRIFFDRLGHVLFEVGDVKDRRAAVDRLEAVVTDVSEYVDYGFIRRSMAPAGAWSDALITTSPEPPRAAGDYYRIIADREDRLVPDAHGVQVLTTHHLENIDLRAWDVRDVGHGRYLVSARDLSQWFSDDGPSPDALEAARRDFQACIWR